jgi:hypothetical protein
MLAIFYLSSFYIFNIALNDFQIVILKVFPRKKQTQDRLLSHLFSDAPH